MVMDLNMFFNPKSVVVVGATTKQSKLGYGVARNLISSGFPGEVYFVNKHGGVLLGQQMYSDLSQIPDNVDLAVLVIPARYVSETMVACSHKGIKTVIIISGGFSENGFAGVQYEINCKQIAVANNMTVLGPNCIGVLDTHAPIDTTFLQPPMPPLGEVGFVSHSGALGAGVIDWAKNAGFSFSKMVSLGNQMMINESDVFATMASDPDTRVIALYLETVKQGEKFIHEAKSASGKKPIIAHKVGKTEEGKRAASSHTGAMAGVDQAFDAAFRRAGIIRANTTEDMFNWSKALAWSPVPQGNRVAILTNAGGPGVTAADAVAANGLTIAELSDETKQNLSALLPEAASVLNPVDMLASASPVDYAACLKILLAAPEVDMVMVISPPPPMFSARNLVNACIPVVKSFTDKPVIFSLMGSIQVGEATEILRHEKIPVYNFPEKAASAMGALWKRAEVQDHLDTTPEIREISAKGKVAYVLEALLAGKEYLVPASVTEQIMDMYGIPVAKLHLADTPVTSSEISNEIGFPVVLKIAADGISHKSDIGGIQLNLSNDKEVMEAFQQLTEAVQQKEPNLKIRGAYVQKMISEGQEVIVGAIRDPIFGPLVMFGSGGVEVEGIQDVLFSLAPVTSYDIEFMLNNTWAGRRLKGFRHYTAGDVSALNEVLVRLGQLMEDHPDIKEVEINPLYVFEEGKGVVAVDMRMYLEEPRE